MGGGGGGPRHRKPWAKNHDRLTFPLICGRLTSVDTAGGHGGLVTSAGITLTTPGSHRRTTAPLQVGPPLPASPALPRHLSLRILIVTRLSGHLSLRLDPLHPRPLRQLIQTRVPTTQGPPSPPAFLRKVCIGDRIVAQSIGLRIALQLHQRAPTETTLKWSRSQSPGIPRLLVLSLLGVNFAFLPISYLRIFICGYVRAWISTRATPRSDTSFILIAQRMSPAN